MTYYIFIWRYNDWQTKLYDKLDNNWLTKNAYSYRKNTYIYYELRLWGTTKYDYDLRVIKRPTFFFLVRLIEVWIVGVLLYLVYVTEIFWSHIKRFLKKTNLICTKTRFLFRLVSRFESDMYHWDIAHVCCSLERSIFNWCNCTLRILF